jgi:hypothetical protein
MLFLMTKASTNIGSALLHVLHSSKERLACILDFGPIDSAAFFSVLLPEMREGSAQRGAGELNQSSVRRVHFQDQEDCTGNRQRGDE